MQENPRNIIPEEPDKIRSAAQKKRMQTGIIWGTLMGVVGGMVFGSAMGNIGSGMALGVGSGLALGISFGAMGGKK